MGGPSGLSGCTTGSAGTGNGYNTSPGVWVTDKGTLLITNMRRTLLPPRECGIILVWVKGDDES
jgi:hypothetical protein